MKPVFQDKFGLGGNCMQAAVASILELPLEAVPNFAEAAKDCCDGDGFWVAVQDFLATRGLYCLTLPAKGPAPKGYHIIFGKSPRGEFLHAIVGYNGKPVHDPHPEGNCALDTIEGYDVFVSLMEERRCKDCGYASFASPGGK